MKNYTTDQIKNLVLLGNSGSGKTTLAEAMLFDGGVIERRGDISGKNTVSDYNPIEQQNGNSVFTSVLYTEYKDKKINLIDAPGFDDFIGGAITALQIMDTALMVINAQNGVEVGTEIQARHAEKYNKPIIFVINHLDHEKANFEKTFEHLKERFGNHAIMVQFPVATGASFNAIIDVLSMKQYKYSNDSGKAEVTEIPADLKDQAEELRNSLIEIAAEADEKLMELFFENNTLTEEELNRGILQGLKQRGMFPVFCVSAKKNIGVDRLLDFIGTVAPSPDEMPAWVNTDGQEIKCSSQGTPSLFVFKSSIESHIGEVNFFKVTSGEITEGIDMTNNSSHTKERVSQIFASAGKNRVKLTKMAAGDIGATVKLKNTKTNHTLVMGKDWKFKPIELPEPKHRTAIKALSESDDEKLGDALNKYHQEDLTIVIQYSKELKQIIISGQGEYHLNILKWHLDNIYKVETEFLKPRIPYRETITKVATAMYRHKKQSGGAGQFGEVHMMIEPYREGAPDPTTFKSEDKDVKLSVRDKEEINLAWGGKLIYYNCIVGGAIDTRFLPAILKGIMEKIEEGPLTGSYARDIRVAVYDGKMHPVDSNEISFKLAGRNAFREGFKKAGPKILEPIYDVEVWVPGDRMGDVMSDLQGRRAIVQGMSSDKGFEIISAKVPLAEMDRYQTSLSSITAGRAMYSMKFAEYAPVPPDVQEELLKAYEAEEKEE